MSTNANIAKDLVIRTLAQIEQMETQIKELPALRISCREALDRCQDLEMELHRKNRTLSHLKELAQRDPVALMTAIEGVQV